jgi:hypothetical protein
MHRKKIKHPSILFFLPSKSIHEERPVPQIYAFHAIQLLVVLLKWMLHDLRKNLCIMGRIFRKISYPIFMNSRRIGNLKSLPGIEKAGNEAHNSANAAPPDISVPSSCIT